MAPSPSIAPDDLRFRPVEEPADSDFLFDLYVSVREDLATIFPEGDQLRQMLKMQFDGQRHSYANDYPAASHDIILLRGRPVGRLLIDRTKDAIHAVDLSLIPECRGQGIGSVVIDGLFAEATRSRLPLVFSVLKTNRAMNLYRRLGCTVDGENATHYFLSWRPDRI